jgi:hypothetical protein
LAIAYVTSCLCFDNHLAVEKVRGHLLTDCFFALQMCVPLFDMIRRWVFEGVLEDPACEFFVVCNTAAAAISSNGDQQRPGLMGSLASRDLWRDAYRLEPAKLPPFISSDLAATILRAGKSINFLRDACEDMQWVQEWAPAAAGAVAELGYGQVGLSGSGPGRLKITQCAPTGRHLPIAAKVQWCGVVATHFTGAMAGSRVWHVPCIL